jgi:PD-(D/E)XK nuclease superfamily protein
MLAVFHGAQDPAVEIVHVQRRLTVPLIDQQTGEVLERQLVVVMDLLERDREGHLVVVDLKATARKYTELQVETSLQLTVYSYAAEMGGLADRGDVRLRFDVLTKTKQPEFHRYPTSRDRRADVKLFRLASEVLRVAGGGGGGVPPDRGVAVQGVSVQGVSVQGAVLGVAVRTHKPLGPGVSIRHVPIVGRRDRIGLDLWCPMRIIRSERDRSRSRWTAATATVM